MVIRPTPHDMIQINFTKLDPELPTPAKAHIGDAAVDLHTRDDFTLYPGDRRPVQTGIRVAIPEGYAGFVLPRSGHAKRAGIGVVNGPGLIDSGYRGEINVLLINHGKDPVKFRKGDRIAQLTVLPVPDIEWVEVDELDETTRGGDGFGSTGV